MQKEWYVVNTYSGHENKVKEKLEMRASSMVEHQPSKLVTRVRFPSPAPSKCANSSAG